MIDNTLLILGNGFDLSLGLKTSYKDFMNSQIFKSFVDKTYLGKHLEQKQSDLLWVDIEKELSKYCLELNYGSLMIPMNQEGKEAFFQEYTLLKESLKKYLLSGLKPSIDYEKSNAQKIIREIEYGDNNRIATFNYTAYAEVISKYTFTQENSKLLHVHGSLSNDDDIVFGVEDTVDIPRNHAFLYKAYSKYKNTSKFANWLFHAENIIFYGYSLGDTDKQYFVEYFRSLCQLQKDKKKIIFCHYGEQAYNDLKWQLRIFTDKQLSAFEMFNDVKFIDCSKEMVLDL